MQIKVKGLYNMPGSKYLWYRWTGQDGKRRAVSLKTDDPAEAIKKVREIQAGAALMRWEMGEPIPTAAWKMVEKYLTTAQKRARKPLRPATAKRQRDILHKFLKDTSVEVLHEISRDKVDDWLEGLRQSG